MLQNPCKTLGFKKNMVYKIPPGGGGKPYPASDLFIDISIFSSGSRQSEPSDQFKVTTDTNNQNYCMTKHILSYNFNICCCYRIYLKLPEMNGICMSDANIMH